MGWWKYRAGECSWGGVFVKRGDFEGIIWAWFAAKR